MFKNPHIKKKTSPQGFFTSHLDNIARKRDFYDTELIHGIHFQNIVIILFSLDRGR